MRIPIWAKQNKQRCRQFDMPALMWEDGNWISFKFYISKDQFISKKWFLFWRNRCDYVEEQQCKMVYEEECTSEQQQKCSTHYRKVSIPSKTELKSLAILRIRTFNYSVVKLSSFFGFSVMKLVVEMNSRSANLHTTMAKIAKTFLKRSAIMWQCRGATKCRARSASLTRCRTATKCRNKCATRWPITTAGLWHTTHLVQ